MANSCKPETERSKQRVTFRGRNSITIVPKIPKRALSPLSPPATLPSITNTEEGFGSTFESLKHPSALCKKNKKEILASTLNQLPDFSSNGFGPSSTLLECRLECRLAARKEEKRTFKKSKRASVRNARAAFQKRRWRSMDSLGVR
jgi:hypothetical protein